MTMKRSRKLSDGRGLASTECSDSPCYYLGLFTVESWREFKSHGGQLMGFNQNKAKTVARLKPGDLILCYLTKVSNFVGVMEVSGQSFVDSKRVWSDGVFPVRLPVRILQELSLMQAVPIHSLRGKLSFLPRGNTSNGWTIYVRSSPRLWSNRDGKVVLNAIKDRIPKVSAEAVEAQDPKPSVTKTPRKNKLPLSTRVGRTAHRSERLSVSEPVELLGSYDSVLSGNKVTGYSVNVPIANTCRPTATCIKTCYFAIGAPSWSNSLRHQRKVYESIKSNFAAFAERVAMEYDQLGLSFIRWNGGGDLFQESVSAINYLGKMRPDIVIWVVTRLPEFAAKIDQASNVYIHFSLDKHSLPRATEFLKSKPSSRNFFFSYQCDANEAPSLENLKGISVLFFDNYKPVGDIDIYDADIVCPLNSVDDISGVCESCRRCFNGSAVNHGKRILHKITSV
jgi:hypothetical protein